VTEQDRITSTWAEADAPVEADNFGSHGVTVDPEIDQLVEEIVYTREEMTGTVEQIGDRLDPKNIVAEATGSVRNATIGKVESVANSASDMVSNVGQTAGEMVSNAGQTAQQAGSGIVGAIRRNPVPAAMVGIGLGWLAMSNRGSSSSSRYSDWSDGGRSWGDGNRMSGSTWDTTGYSDSGSGFGGQGFTDKVGNTAGRVGDTAGQVVGNVQQTAGEVVQNVQQTAGQVPYQVQGVARQVQDNAGRMIQENPLAVGAIALALGTAVGMALPSTQKEQQILGQARDNLIDKAETKASDAMSKVEETAKQS
jgi:ElaB/YqjD/DUF883 family membrane-anchored ribosome-binding protein